ncbi:MAG: DNA repair protein RecN [Microcoleaceae cyanobacterium]
MLLSLRIENFALVDHLDLDLGSGLNVFTGETGAGKSIILDAVDAVLGGRAERRVIRTGTTRATLEATFELDQGTATWMTQQEIDLIDNSVLVCSREISSPDGKTRSRFRLNGTLVNGKLINQLRERLLEITAQGQTVQLLASDLQREWLDLYGGPALAEAGQAVAQIYTQMQQAKADLEHRREFEQQRLQRLDLLQYQAEELEAAQLTDANELDELIQEHQRLSHVVELQQQSYQIYQALYQGEENQAAADLLSQAEATLTDLVEYDSQLQPILSMVEEALAQVTEAGRQIGSYGEQLESDPQRLQEVEERIQELKQLCRKYGPTLADVVEHDAKIRAELEELQDSEQSLEALEQVYEQHKAHLTKACERLTQLRQQTANQLETNLVKELKPLAMEKVKFQVEITPITPTASGADRIQFCFSPNPGEPLKPLSETASVGEMSRFLLALKACFSQVDAVGTLVFDEIDVGVSGRVAGAIAQKLNQLSQAHQVLCVTHQPIVAAIGDRHFHVEKHVIAEPQADSQTDSQPEAEGTDQQDGNPEDNTLQGTNTQRTVVRVTPLNSQQRKEELAQLASGKSGKEALVFAESLLNQADALRQPKAEPKKRSRARSRKDKSNTSTKLTVS